MSSSNDLLAGAEAASAYLGLTQRVIYHLAEQNRIPFVRLGRRLYFSKAALDRAFGKIAASDDRTIN